MTGKLMATAALTALTATTALWPFERVPDIHLLQVKPIKVWHMRVPIQGCFK